jgi:hypothetical protein
LKVSCASAIFVSLLVALLLALPSGGHRHAAACSCAPLPEPNDALGASSAVFVGKVSGIELNDEKTITVGTVFEIWRAWKGIEAGHSGTITMRPLGHECSYGFVEGEVYLVYASGDLDQLSTSICSRTTELRNAADDLRVLGPGPVSFQDSGGLKDYNFTIWPLESEISLNWQTDIRTQVCPNPDFQQIGTDTFRDPSDLVISYIATNSDGVSSDIITEYMGGRNDFCNGPVGFGFVPDSSGLWRIRANATWISSTGENQTLQSNEITVLAKPAVYATSLSEVLLEFDPNSSNSLRLLDWSSDGKSILVATDFSFDGNDTENSELEYDERNETHLGFLDPDDGTVERIDLPEDFVMIYDARFSPSSDLTLMLVGQTGYSDEARLFLFSIGDGSLDRIGNATGDIVWVPDTSDDGQDDFVIGRTLSNETGGKIFEMWRTDSRANPIEKIYSTHLGDKEGFQIHDSSRDGKKILMTDSEWLGGPITVYNITIFDTESKQFESTLPFGTAEGVRFNPSGDLIIYDIGYGHRSPGGPLIVTTLDGSYIERLSTGESPGTYDSPISYVISPDGSSIVAAVEQWGGGKIYVTKNSLARAMPEFDSLNVLGIAVGLSSTVLVLKRFFSLGGGIRFNESRQSPS